MSDNDNPLPVVVAVSATPPKEDDSRATPAGDNNKYCASLRRVHKIGPFSGELKNDREENDKDAKRRKSSSNKKKKDQQKKSPIRIFMRPLPGRSFDGFLDRFVKSNILGFKKS